MNIAPGPGLILIPDISGYTEFINTVEIQHGQHIVADLLELLLRHNRLGLRLSEVEGDALLLYRPGAPPSQAELWEQTRDWFLAFHRHLSLLRYEVFCDCGACQYVGRMTLKVIAHYGPFAAYNIGGHDKLVGKEIILAHRLLKNSVPGREYLLLTDALTDTAPGVLPEQAQAIPHQESIPVFGELHTHYVSLSPLHAEAAQADGPDEWRPARGEAFVMERTSIRAPIARVVRAVSDLEEQQRWIPGVEEMRYDPTAPVGVGHHHVCVIDGTEMQNEISAVEHREGHMVLSVDVKPPVPLVRSLTRTFTVDGADGDVHVTAYFAWRAWPVLGTMFRLMAVRRLRRMLAVGLNQLRDMLEAEAPAA